MRWLHANALPVGAILCFLGLSVAAIGLLKRRANDYVLGVAYLLFFGGILLWGHF